MNKRFSIIVWICDSIEQLVQLTALIIAMLLPFVFDFQVVVKQKQPEMKIQDLVVYYALRHGNICISMVLAVLMITMFHKINANKTLNKGNRYHRRTMFGYWIYSYVLGYTKCSLIRVPIVDQYKLILSDMFENYILGDYNDANEDEKITVRKYGQLSCSTLIDNNAVDNTSKIKLTGNNIYIAISDTYPIKEDMLPGKCNEHNTVIIQREINKNDSTRYKSKLLVKRVLKIVKDIDSEGIVNILPTTNVINTFDIVNEVFKTGGQDNIKHLYVFPQPHKTVDDWSFAEKGRKIF